MDRWDPIQVTSTYRPQLEPQETIQATQDQVGLYEGRLKAEDYPNGTIYLTCYRILYIDAKDPVRKSIGLQLRLIHGIQHYGGFMSSSPKLTLELYPRSIAADPQSSSDVLSSQSTTSGLISDLNSLSVKDEPAWICAICYNSNQGSCIKCTVCGVRKPPRSEDTHVSPPADPFLLNKPDRPDDSVNRSSMTSPHSVYPTGNISASEPDQPGIACPACTFHNDPFMVQCEMCGTDLQDAQSKAFMLHRQEQHQRSISQLPSSIGNASLSSTSTQQLESTSAKSSANNKFLLSVSSLYSGSSPKQPDDANIVKLSFRAGGNGAFHSLLRTAMATRAWESKPKPRPVDTPSLPLPQPTSSTPSPAIRVGGISGIMRTVETNKKATDDTLSQAFQDLQGLMHKAKEMVALAETISKRLAKSNTMDNEETATFKTYLLSMGIASPVTKDTAGAVFHKELARELVEFILPLVEREGGTMSLMDVYCVFNRARGVELISPKDLHTACQLFSELNLPLRLRKFDSGLLVIQTMERYSDDEVSVSITNHIQDLPPGAGLTAVELAGAIQISVALAQEQLLMTEARGLICRDETVDGLRFYDNLFAKWEI
ncbi:EAP30/Vps36 family-domain-containing protein [Mortierella sp. GBAus27b]|nr:EAP30/Vps36 family-domain-containing protein [Mortierella sp. GBAus27b]